MTTLVFYRKVNFYRQIYQFNRFKLNQMAGLRKHIKMKANNTINDNLLLLKGVTAHTDGYYNLADYKLAIASQPVAFIHKIFYQVLINLLSADQGLKLNGAAIRKLSSLFSTADVKRILGTQTLATANIASSQILDNICSVEDLIANLEHLYFIQSNQELWAIVKLKLNLVDKGNLQLAAIVNSVTLDDIVLTSARKYCQHTINFVDEHIKRCARSTR